MLQIMRKTKVNKSIELLARLSTILGTVDAFNDRDDNDLQDYIEAKRAQEQLQGIIQQLSEVHLALNENEVANLKQESKEIFNELDTSFISHFLFFVKL